MTFVISAIWQLYALLKLSLSAILTAACVQILQEKEEEKLASKIGVPLAFINPSCILGPILSPKASGFSIEIMKVSAFFVTHAAFLTCIDLFPVLESIVHDFTSTNAETPSLFCLLVNWVLFGSAKAVANTK